ncbi:MAG TPA: hypothetical protein DEP40_09210, partial [Enterococcus sp.]|nr:hypothetical protein [Enterococcus sp.]
EAGTEVFNSENKKKLTKITFQILVDFGLFKKELLLLPRSFSSKEQAGWSENSFPYFWDCSACF